MWVLDILNLLNILNVFFFFLTLALVQFLQNSQQNKFPMLLLRDIFSLGLYCGTMSISGLDSP